MRNGTAAGSSQGTAAARRRHAILFASQKGSAMRAMHVFLLGAVLSLPVATSRAAEVKGTHVVERTSKALTAIPWAGDIDQVLEKAKKERKLVFWLQIVGDLAGGL